MELKKIKIILIIFLVVAILIPNVIYATNDNETNNTKEETEDDATDETDEDDIYYITQSGKNLDIQTQAVILIDSTTGAILYSKNAEEKMYPASTTKIMTAILTIENGNLDETTTVSAEAIANIPSGYSTSYFAEGEILAVSDLLKALFLNSSNDSTNVLAEYISGSIEDFVILMNEKATELGCTNTNFVNTNGIANESHYSTAKDLAIIAQYCMQNSTFRSYAAMIEGTIDTTNKFDEKRVYTNTNRLLLENDEYYREDCIGIKTGFTSQAEYCLIAACADENTELIAITLGSSSLNERYTETATLFDYGYEAMSEIDLENTEDISYIVSQPETEELIDIDLPIFTEDGSIDLDPSDPNNKPIIIAGITLVIISILLILKISRSSKSNKTHKRKH